MGKEPKVKEKKSWGGGRRLFDRQCFDSLPLHAVDGAMVPFLKVLRAWRKNTSKTKKDYLKMQKKMEIVGMNWIIFHT